MASFKRPRSTSVSSDSSTSSIQTLPAKSSRTTIPSTSSPAPLLCTLPPTCSLQHPTPLAGPAELEAHYATHHAYVCTAETCGAVFPDGRLLELHQTECHDPIAALRKERGEKIFACHLPTCPRLFSTPKTRRLHLIAVHAYPRAYFFAVTNKGIGGLLKKWGAGASLIRDEWRGDKRIGRQEETMEDEENENDYDDGDEEHKASVDALADSMTGMAIGTVPNAIRFGRGGKSAGLAGSSGFAGRGGKAKGKGKQEFGAENNTPNFRPTVERRQEPEHQGDGVFREPESPPVEKTEPVFAFVPRNVRARGRGRGRGAAVINHTQPQQTNSAGPAARGRGTAMPLRRGLALGPMRIVQRGRGRGRGTVGTQE